MSSADTVNNKLTANCCLSMRKVHCFVSVGKRSVVREKGSSTKYVPLGGEGGGVFLNLVFIQFDNKNCQHIPYVTQYAFRMFLILRINVIREK